MLQLRMSPVDLASFSSKVAELTREWAEKWRDIQRIVKVIILDLSYYYISCWLMVFSWHSRTMLPTMDTWKYVQYIFMAYFCCKTDSVKSALMLSLLAPLMGAYFYRVLIIAWQHLRAAMALLSNHKVSLAPWLYTQQTFLECWLRHLRMSSVHDLHTLPHVACIVDRFHQLVCIHHRAHKWGVLAYILQSRGPTSGVSSASTELETLPFCLSTHSYHICKCTMLCWTVLACLQVCIERCIERVLHIKIKMGAYIEGVLTFNECLLSRFYIVPYSLD